jgi:hypothetical protein
MSRNPQSYNITFNIQPDIKPIMRGRPMSYQPSIPTPVPRPVMAAPRSAPIMAAPQSAPIEYIDSPVSVPVSSPLYAPAPAPASSGLGKTTSYILILLGMCCIFCSVCTSGSDGDYSAEAEATVVSSKCQNDNNGSVCVTKIKFTDKYDREYTTKIKTYNPQEKGDEILIHYNPQMPKDARLAQPYNHMFSSLSLTFGLLLIILSIVMFS